MGVREEAEAGDIGETGIVEEEDSGEESLGCSGSQRVLEESISSALLLLCFLVVVFFSFSFAACFVGKGAKYSATLKYIN